VVGGEVGVEGEGLDAVFGLGVAELNKLNEGRLPGAASSVGTTVATTGAGRVVVGEGAWVGKGGDPPSFTADTAVISGLQEARSSKQKAASRTNWQFVLQGRKFRILRAGRR
jgi:hypothetical protein